LFRTADALAPLRAAFAGLEALLTRAAIGAARTSLWLKNVEKGHGALEEGADSIRGATEALRKSFVAAAEGAKNSAGTAREMAGLTREGHAASERSVRAMRALRAQSEGTGARLKSLLGDVQEVTHVSRVIEEITGRTHMLALNATIEAARAGAAGRGFAVVADEVRRLARGTAEKTRQIDELLAKILEELDPVRAAVDQSMTIAGETTEQVEAVGARFEQLNALAQSTSTHVAEVAQALADQSGAVSTLASGAHDALQAVRTLREETGRIAADSFALSELVEESHEHLAALDSGSLFHRALALGRELAERSALVLERPVAEGQLRLADLLELRYEEFKGPAIAELSRLFDVTRVPATGFTPPKYRTAYDALVDTQLQPIFDEILGREKALIFALIIDLNSYGPTHNSMYMKPCTGVPAEDVSGNRVKRFFTDNNVLVRGGRVGLGAPARKVPQRAERGDFLRAGCELAEKPGARDAFLVQTYARDTGAIATALTVPLFVNGQRWGSSLLGWTADGSR
jgi:methyl-accepting chemotaxis protein